METQSYYLFPESQADCFSDSVPMRVNCAGYVKLSTPFWNSGKRSDWYLQLIDEGTLTEDTQTLSAGQFIIRSPHKPYRYGLGSEDILSYYWIHFTGSSAQRLLQECGIEANRIYTLPEGLTSTIRRDFSSMFREFMFRQQNYADMTAAYATEVLVRLSRCAAEAGSGSLRSRLATSAEFIHKHYTEVLRVSELAQMEHLCESRFRELFREAFGASPNDYIIQLRLLHAADLLTQSDLSIAQIAEMCGYADALYFSRLFRRKNGVSPAAYRKNVAM